MLDLPPDEFHVNGAENKLAMSGKNDKDSTGPGVYRSGLDSMPWRAADRFQNG